MPNRRYSDVKFLDPTMKRFERTQASWYLKPWNILGCPYCFQRPRYWRTRSQTIFTNIINFKVLEQPENLTHIWKFVEIEHPWISCLNNVGRLSFIMYSHKRSALLWKLWFHYIWLNISKYKQFHNNHLKKKESNVKGEDLRGHCFVSTNVKHPVYKIMKKIVPLPLFAASTHQGLPTVVIA